MKKVGIITMHNVANFGAVLQTYALKHVVESKGHNAEIINYKPWYRRGLRLYFPVMDGNPVIKLLRCLKWLPKRLRWQKPYKNFVKSEIRDVTDIYYSPEDLEKNPPIYDVYITGSDQVWNPDSTCGLDKAYFLSFAPSEKIKLSYAASISAQALQPEQVSSLTEWLSDYNGISVREDTAKALLSDIGIENVVQVLDPTLLLTKDEWHGFGNRSQIQPEDKYLLIFILNNSSELIRYGEKVAKELGLKAYKLGWDFFKDRNTDVDFAFRSPYDFVKLFDNAEFVVTNSFHGTAFSVNFNKPFITCPSSENNPRFMSILRMLNLTNRVYNPKKPICEYINDKIDFGAVNEILEQRRKTSVQFLFKTIDGE